jgi:hypothetical protein
MGDKEKVCPEVGVCSNGSEKNAGKNAGNREIAFGEAGYVLSSGFDSLTLSLTVLWKDEKFFKKLRKLRADAAAQEAPLPGQIESGSHSWIFNVHGYGNEGYAFLLDSNEFFVKIIDSMVPKPRPSVMIDIRSATLWESGVIESIDRILTLLQGQGAFIQKARASRVDPCMDILLPKSIWTPALEDHLIKQADAFAAHKRGRILTGMSIGRGVIRARAYDKPYEIETKSKKYWMFDIWDVKKVPEDGRIIRIEYQLRREALRELGIDTVWHLVNYPRNLWAYCTEKWLKFQKNAKVHHTQQKPMPWWKTVQDSFLGGQRACPLLRAKIVSANKVQLAQQMFGQLTSLLALESKGNIKPGGKLSVSKVLRKVKACAAMLDMSSTKCYEKVRRKIAKYAKAVQKFKDAEEERKALGLPEMGKQLGKKGGAK